MGKVYDVIIIGSGPAGISAAIYAKRAGISTIIVEKSGVSGGQIINTYEVDNYPGLPGISGMELGATMREHAEKMGADFVEAEVIKLETGIGTYKVITAEDRYETKTIILAMGAHHAKLLVPGEEELCGMGVSYCATCDGAFFKNKVVAVAGGGDVAVEDAIFLARGCKKVYVIHRRDELRAAKVLQDTLLQLENVEVVWDSVVTKIEGEDQVSSILIRNRKSGDTRRIELDAIFIAVGIYPDTEICNEIVTCNENGYIIAGEDGITSIPGIFAAGDIRTKMLRQVITAAADGANCVTSVERYLTTV